ncbi:MAG: hypothetical protein RM338_19760, partial [Nostoc sp. DedQUE12a]|nr:hypothetical protein [Nostoc sp. DedQUE12a]
QRTCVVNQRTCVVNQRTCVVNQRTCVVNQRTCVVNQRTCVELDDSIRRQALYSLVQIGSGNQKAIVPLVELIGKLQLK